jgi:hypothetical protein
MSTVSLPRLLLITGIAVFAISVPGFMYVAATSGRSVASLDAIKLVVLSSLGVSLFTVVLVAAIGAWVGVVSNLLKIARSRKPGVAAFDHRLLFNPFNAVFLPQYLTDEGLSARRRLLVYALVFVLSIGAGFGVKWLVTVAT